jgi:hypothetical protein
VKLLDAAEVKTEARGGWERGWDGDTRPCGGIHVYLSECDPDATSDVIGDADTTVEDCGYRVVPFGIVATLHRQVRAEKPDDADWLATALRNGSEIPVSRGLLVRQGMGSALGDTWLGNPLVEEVPAPALTDGNAVAAAVSDARRIFFQRTIDLSPILHVNPSNAIALKKAGVVELDPNNGDDRTAWGDPVVVSEGYYDIPDLSAVPAAFWTGPISITLSEVNAEDAARAVQQNRVMQQVTRIAAIDTLPCAMVRIGAAPAPVG